MRVRRWKVREGPGEKCGAASESGKREAELFMLASADVSGTIHADSRSTIISNVAPSTLWAGRMVY